MAIRSPVSKVQTEPYARPLLEVGEKLKEAVTSTTVTSCHVYVGNLAYKVTEQDLEEVFKSCGTITGLTLATEGGVEGARSKGYALLEFSSPDEAQRAVALHDTKFMGRPLLVREDRGSGWDGANATAGPIRARAQALAADLPGNSAGTHERADCRVYVGNLPYSVDWNILKRFCSVCGDIRWADVITDAEGKSKGFGIVEYLTAAEAKRAIKHLNNTDLMGRSALVRADRSDHSPTDASIGGNDLRTSQKASFPPAEPGARLYVGNLSFDVKWQDLKDHFRSIGPVLRADVITEDGVEGGRSRGWGIIEYRTAAEAQKAIADMHDTEFFGRPLLVREDREASGNGAEGCIGPSIDRITNPTVPIEESSNAEDDGPISKLFVANFPYEATQGDLMDLFRACGEVEVVKATIMTEGGVKGGRSKGWGIVEFRSDEDAAWAIEEFHNTEFMGRTLIVRKERSSSGSEMIMRGGWKGAPPECNVFVSNLDFGVNWQALKDHMRAAGEVIHAEVMTDGGGAKGRSKGCGVVQYASPEIAQAAVEELNDTILLGQPIFVRASMD
eukprot:TRINITY_DN45832_c0_g1_i1.p1 TRINITY_DN45832_c0_g1~~TRINITY_DN45832_c0_g1_i1.p1  ORF type:complete len:589 (-),score=81.58 TRINITY_DN45832_c0_g1_i1:78-1754(-)